MTNFKELFESQNLNEMTMGPKEKKILRAAKQTYKDFQEWEPAQRKQFYDFVNKNGYDKADIKKFAKDLDWRSMVNYALEYSRMAQLIRQKYIGNGEVNF